MDVISHQTVRLQKGQHSSPTEGMCVMELASVLAGERFSDHPRAVCPVIAGLLRAYNDSLDDKRRQRLIPYAAAVVGTRAGRDVQRARAARCLAWALEHGGRLPRWQWRLRRLARGGRAPLAGAVAAHWAIGRYRALDDDGHAAVLALVDELIELGRPSAPGAVPDPLATAPEPEEEATARRL